MSSAHASPQMAAEHDPDAGWKPNNRPQSTVARNFMTELDDLFRLDGGIDLLDKNVHQKKQAVSTHTQELEALEAKLRETEQRLQQARNSPPRRKDSQRRTPIEGAFPTPNPTPDDKAPLNGSPQRYKENMAPRAQQNMPDRPLTARTDDEEKA